MAKSCQSYGIIYFDSARLELNFTIDREGVFRPGLHMRSIEYTVSKNFIGREQAVFQTF